MLAHIIHQHGLEIKINKNDYYYNSNYNFYEKGKMITLEKNIIYNFYCPICKRYSLNYFYNHDNYNYNYMVNPPDSSYYIQLNDNFNIGYILLGNEYERDYYIYNYFNNEIKKLKINNKNLINEKSNLNEKKNQILRNKNLLENENSRLYKEVETLIYNQDENEKKFKNQINNLNNKIEEIKDFGLKFKSDNNEKAFYDIIVNITSIKNLNNEGWIVKYPKEEKGRDYYNVAKDDPTIIVGVIGNGNKGKSFLLEKLSEYEIPKGFNVKTEGLSIRYGEEKDHKLAILDSAGQETPLLKNNFQIKETKKDSNPNGLNIENDDLKDIINESKFEEYCRDKLITELFIQKFIINKSDILIIVIGNMTLNEQQLLARIKKEAKNKQIYVVHNLQNYQTHEQVDDYIENTLKNLFDINIEENIYQKFIKDEKESNEKYFTKYFIEKGKSSNEDDKKCPVHLILVNDYSEINKYYNKPTINFLKKEMEGVKTREKFPIIDECKKFLKNLSEEIIEEKINEESICVEEIDKNNDKIYIKNLETITLKKFVIDEMGYTLNDKGSLPKYSYYVKGNYFHIFIELPGGGKIKNKAESIQGYYLFTFEGIQNGDKEIEDDSKKEKSELLCRKSTRKTNKFKFGIKIPNTTFQLNDYKPEKKTENKGVIEYIYKIKIIEQNEDSEDEF